MAPAVVFVEVFKRQGAPITMEEARAPMGAHKRVHIQRITELDSVRQRWKEKHGRLPNDDDVTAMFAEFVPLQLKCLSDYSELIPGTLEAVAAMRARGAKIGSTTGYTTEMMKINPADAAKQGYVPDSTVCASDVPAGQPFPHMCLQNVINLGISPVEACVKVDDTRPGIEEGLNAGMWTIGLALSGNEIGLPLANWRKLPAAERERMRQAAYLRMYQSTSTDKYLAIRNLANDPYRTLIKAPSAHASEAAIRRLFWWLWVTVFSFSSVHLLWHLAHPEWRPG